MEFLNNLFGLHTSNLETFQMVARAATAFFSALILIRISGIRTLGKQTSFDHVTALIIGSILGRAVVAGENYFGNLTAVLVLALLHRLISWLTFKSKKIGSILKGEPLLLMINGEKNTENLKKALITNEDLNESLHLSLNTDELQTIKAIYLERSGKISFIKKEKDE